MKRSFLWMAGFSLAIIACTNESSTDSPINDSSNLKGSLSSDMVIIDFEEFSVGDIVSTTSPQGCAGQIGVFALNPDPNVANTNAAMVFDSSNPTGGDVDLGSPNSLYGGPGISADGDQASNDTALGKVLIITEDFDSTDPDDSYVAGSYYEFDFSGYGNGAVEMVGFDMLDLDPPGANDLPTIVKLFDSSDNLLFEKELQPGEDNSKQFVDLENTSSVSKMVLELNNSGAIDNIKFRCGDIEIGGCETMFGRDQNGAERCFDQDDFSRWGWTNGPFGEGTHTFDIYAGAGQCDISKGELAGTVTVEYSGGTVDVTYESNGDFVFTETHLYVGNDMYPQQKRGNRYVNTVAPGQYPEKHGNLDNVLEDSYTVYNLEGEIWVIAHGVVCEIIR